MCLCLLFSPQVFYVLSTDDEHESDILPPRHAFWAYYNAYVGDDRQNQLQHLIAICWDSGWGDVGDGVE